MLSYLRFSILWVQKQFTLPTTLLIVNNWLKGNVFPHHIIVTIPHRNKIKNLYDRFSIIELSEFQYHIIKCNHK